MLNLTQLLFIFLKIYISWTYKMWTINLIVLRLVFKNSLKLWKTTYRIRRQFELKNSISTRKRYNNLKLVRRN